MFKGTVSFVAKIKGSPLELPLVEFNPNEGGVKKVEIEERNGDEIRTTVYLTSVTSRDEGRTLAAKVTKRVLDRIAFRYDLAIEGARIAGGHFSPLNCEASRHVEFTRQIPVSWILTKVVLTPAELKGQLEQPSLTGEQHFGLFRSARQSTGPVEEFMHLYNLLLMLCGDNLRKVDAFISSKEPNVLQSKNPKRGHMETVYTRLRNELGHSRTGGNLDNTKAEMARYLEGLITLTKQAMEDHGAP